MAPKIGPVIGAFRAKPRDFRPFPEKNIFIFLPHTKNRRQKPRALHGGHIPCPITAARTRDAAMEYPATPMQPRPEHPCAQGSPRATPRARWRHAGGARAP